MRKLLLIVTGLVCFRIFVVAQIIPFQNYYTIQDGLPSKTIFDIEQDRMGYLWFATQAGVVRFDGYNFRTYASEDGLPDNNIIDIFIASDRSIWFATKSGGLARLKNDKITVVNQQNGLISNASIAVFEDRQQNIWYTSFEGISIIHNGTISNFNSENSILTGEILKHYVAKDGTVWISTMEQLFYYNNGFHACMNEALDNVIIRDLCENNKGSYWFATDGKGVVHIENSQVNTISKKEGLCSNRVFALAVLSKDTVVVGCDHPAGLYKIVDNRIVQKWEEDLKPYHIQQILVDRKKRVWINTAENGLLLLEKNSLNHIDKKNNLAGNRVYKLFEDLNGNIWIATGNGLSKYGKAIFQIYNEGFINNETEILSIASQKNEVYLSTYSGLNIIRGNEVLQDYSMNDLLPFRAYIISILPVNKSRIWFGTDQGLTLFEGRSYKHFPFSNNYSFENTPSWITDLEEQGDTIYCATDRGLVRFCNNRYETIEMADAGIWSIEIDDHHNIWCATENGLAIYDGKKSHHYNTDRGLPHQYCSDLAFDREGYTWIATDRGLSRVKLHNDWTITCMNIDQSKGMGSDIIYSVIVDESGYIWAGHNFGLDKIDPVNFRINHYGPLEGFLPVETSLGAVTLTAGKDLWFGTAGGAVKYIHDNDYIHTDPPLLYLSGIKFYEDTTSILKYAQGVDSITKLPDKLRLPYNKNNLVFSYVGIHYTIIEKNQYKYFLQGYDEDWSTPTSKTETPPYRKVPPGNYTFKIIAANCDGVWSGKPVEFSFEIRPPFYKTWWCIVLEVLIGIVILLGIMRIRVRKLQHDKMVLTQKVKERTIEIEQQRDQIASQKKAITDSIIYAEKIQVAALPDEAHINLLLKEYFILYKPRDIVSGDFYWINRVNDRVIVIAADCTGHGVPGAFMSMLGITTLNEVVSPRNITNSGKLLDTLREHLTKTLGQTGKEEDAKDGMDLALCIFDFNDLKLQFSGAYNPLIHIRNKQITTYKADKMPVGIHLGEMPPFTTYHIDLQKGDAVYIFSDGYADQFGGPDGKKFKSVQFYELLVKISDLPMKEQKDRLNETILNWMGINEQVDDMLVIGIRI